MAHAHINEEACAESQFDPVEILYRKYAPSVYKFALVSTRNRIDAEDVVQEVFLRVFKNWSSFRGDAHVRTWIFQITHNYLVDLGKKKTKETKVVFKVPKDRYFDLLNSDLELEDILSDLSDSQKKVVDLRILRDLSVADTAHMLQCSQGKVRTETHRALKRLRKSAR